MFYDLSAIELIVIGVAAFATAVMGGVAGIGTAIAMIPVMAFIIGVRDAVPLVTVAITLNNFGRIWANWRPIDWRVVVWFSLGAIPLSVLGGIAFANAPADLLARSLAVFLIALVVYRHLPIGRGTSFTNVRWFSAVGGAQGFLSSIFGGAGPFGAHFFLAYGLYRNAFVGTTAVATTSINFAKAGTYAKFALIGADALLLGLIVGIIMVAGAYVGGRLVSRVPDRLFVYIVEGVMLAAAAGLLVEG